MIEYFSGEVTEPPTNKATLSRVVRAAGSTMKSLQRTLLIENETSVPGADIENSRQTPTVAAPEGPEGK